MMAFYPSGKRGKSTILHEYLLYILHKKNAPAYLKNLVVNIILVLLRRAILNDLAMRQSLQTPC